MQINLSQLLFYCSNHCSNANDTLSLSKQTSWQYIEEQNKHHGNLDNGNRLWTTQIHGKQELDQIQLAKEHCGLCDHSPHLTSHPHTPTHAMNLVFPRMLLPNAQTPWGFLCTVHFLVNKLGFRHFTDDCDNVLLVLDTEQPELQLLLTQPCL